MSKTSEIKKYSSPCGLDICFPVTKIKGANAGPKVLIIAGIHGCEYPSIVAAIRISQELKPEDVSGEITVIPICNIQSFEKRMPFLCPVDGKNLNRVFPGSLTGTYTDAMAYYLYQDFITKADYLIDLHGGDMVEKLEPFVIYHEGENEEITRRTREMVDYFGLPRAVCTRHGTARDGSTSTQGCASRAGVPAILTEAGGIGQLDQPSVDLHLAGTRNVLRHLKVLKGEAVKHDVKYYSEMVLLYTPVAGIFYRAVEVSDTVKEGQKVGHMEDYFGNILAEIKAPNDGRIFYLTSSPIMQKDGLLGGLGVE